MKCITYSNTAETHLPHLEVKLPSPDRRKEILSSVAITLLIVANS